VVEPGSQFDVQHWLEHVDGAFAPLAKTKGGLGTVWQSGHITYCAATTDQSGLKSVLKPLCEQAGLAPIDLPRDIRLRSNGRLRFAFNYGAEPVELPESLNGDFQIGGREIGPAGVSILLD
jgi:beta-galactosidase